MTTSVEPALRAFRARLPLYRRPTVLGLSIFGYVLFAWLMIIVPTMPTFKSVVGYDSVAYWNVDAFHPYAAPLGELGSYTYSPALALLAAPFHLLPYGVFFVLWDSFLIVNLVWLTRRMALVWMVFLPVPLELFHGNIHLLLATVCVLGFEYPALWAFGLLSKITPGVALLWFLVRREWRSLAIALGATVVFAAVSFVIAPGAWWDWASFLKTSQDTGAGSNYLFEPYLPPMWIRAIIAAAVVVWGARTDRRWVVPVAVVIAMPVIWITTPAILAAIPRLRRKQAAPVDAESGTIDSSASGGTPIAPTTAPIVPVGS